MRQPALRAASRIAAATGARLIGETFPARHERGAGIPCPQRPVIPLEADRKRLA
jgi:acetolactate synthase-1/2/3 large subunit